MIGGIRKNMKRKRQHFAQTRLYKKLRSTVSQLVCFQGEPSSRWSEFFIYFQRTEFIRVERCNIQAQIYSWELEEREKSPLDGFALRIENKSEVQAAYQTDILAGTYSGRMEREPSRGNGYLSLYRGIGSNFLQRAKGRRKTAEKWSEIVDEEHATQTIKRAKKLDFLLKQ